MRYTPRSATAASARRSTAGWSRCAPSCTTATRSKSSLRGRLRLRSDDFDLVAVVQLGAQRDHPAVDLRADAAVADLGVYRIGEVDRRGATRERDQIALRGEGEHLVMEHLELGMLEELLRPGGVVEDFQQ